MQRIAIIDMGTNTFHLLVADLCPPAGWKIVHRDIEAVKIGLSGINEGLITESAFQRALGAMARFAKSVGPLGVTATYAFGTSAFRNARNAPELISEIRAQTGIIVEVIDGDKEAEFIFAGVSAAVEMGEQPSLVMDIGAGSVEFIIGDRQRILWKRSFEIGGQRLLEKFQKHDPILMEEIEALESYLEATLGDLLASLSELQPRVLIGSSGTFDTLSDIFRIRKKIPGIHDAPETPLSLEAFHEIYQELIRKNRAERMQIEGMVELRVDLIVVSCCLIHFVLKKHQFDRIRVSSFSLKEGVLAKLAAHFDNAASQHRE